ncbi:MAG: tRNA dihydrouridine(20/20a) synthase DusA [Devosiaceae bacterium]|nr:tRNA dihydrouridine(20/20a) synthase DusA [Devosiaceae bacterium]
MLTNEKIFAIAPMLDWTDRHFRFLVRLLTKEALLFTEMITSPAIIHGDRERLLGFDEVEHKIVVQIAGSNPTELAKATKICADYGYDEINLNVGCPSDRVQSGSFGACLMAKPDLVAKSVSAMVNASDKPVSVKCRIGIDEQDIEQALDILCDKIIEAGVSKIYVHARKAWLQGLSPKENRTIPELNYDRVYRLKQRLKDFPIIINGGIETLEQSKEHLSHVDGVMLGRAAYHNTMILSEVDQQIFGKTTPVISQEEIEQKMLNYIESQLIKGTKLNQITRHMLGLAMGQRGAKSFRRILTLDISKKGAGVEVIENAFKALQLPSPSRGGIEGGG